MRTTNLRGTLSALRRVVLGLAALCAVNCPAADLNARVAAAGEGLRGPDSWGMIPRHPAVVNAVTDEPSADRISLCGEWDFFAPKRYDNYRTACWENMHLLSDEKRALRGEKGSAFVRKMNVPGCWEGQGFGEEGEGRGWAVVSDRSQPVMRHVWFGQAWYRRYVDVPKSWAGKRIWLKTGGAMSQGWFWVNDRQVAWWDFYCGTYKYEITDFVKPGERAKIDVMASNLPPCRRGNFVSGNHWGGITRAVELEATPATLIDDAWARGDFDARAAEVHVTVTGPGAKGAAVRVTVAGATAEAPAAADGAETVLRVPLKDFRAWSPEHPHLYVAAIELLEGGRVTMTRRERFGVRKLEVCGKEFRLNGKPFYFRGAGYHNIDPIHGMRPPDRAFYLDELRHVKAAGFNALRTHTRCETPEFFEACDELGLLVQPELPYYTDSPTDDFRFDPVGDVLELYANYRRHPSFAVYSGGNEGSFGPDLSRRIHALVKSLDPDRLAIDQDRWGELPTDRTDYQMNFMAPWPRGSYDPAQPFLAHEYLNLAVKIDARTEPKYTGVKPPPVTVKGRTEWLAKFGLSWDFGVKLQEAQHRLQAYWQKDGFESARNDPHCDGFYYWSLQDVAGIQGTARTAQALFDPFWGEKPCGWTAREFAAFNSPVCVLTDVEGRRATERVFTSGEKAAIVFRVSQYGEEPVKGAALAWRLVASGGRTLAEGRAAPGDLACGPVREVARAEVTFPDVPSAAKAVLEVRLTDAAGRLAAPANSWNFWVFPKRVPRDGSRIAAADEWRAALAKGYPGVRPLSEMDRADVVIARHFDQETVAKARAAGKHLITVEKVKGPSANRLGWWSITSQAGAAYARRPEFRHFPHEGFHDALAFRLLKQAETKLPFEDLSEKDLLVAGEGGEACYFYFGEKPRADGRKWYVAFGFDLLADYPEARAVLDGVLEQCDSAAGDLK